MNCRILFLYDDLLLTHITYMVSQKMSLLWLALTLTYVS